VNEQQETPIDHDVMKCLIVVNEQQEKRTDRHLQSVQVFWHQQCVDAAEGDLRLQEGSSSGPYARSKNGPNQSGVMGEDGSADGNLDRGGGW
jgi:hypothetical protein